MLLEFKDVGRVFKRVSRLVVALDRVSFGADGGECVAVYGSSRSGKSTLLRLAAGVDAPTSGSVLYDGADLGALGERERASLLRSQIAWVPAAPDFHPGLSVLEQVALGAYLASRDYARVNGHAREALEAAGIAHCADAQPAELSDGELRLLAIAQALVKRPRLLLADEPASNLDPAERDRVLELLRACATERGAGVLFSATHAEETLRCTWLVRLDAGRLTQPSRPGGGEVIDFPGRTVASDRARA